MRPLQVGSVITTGDLTQVLGIGYNGNARGLPNAAIPRTGIVRLPSQRAELPDQGWGPDPRQGHVRQCLALRDVRQDDHQHQRHARLLQRAYRDPAASTFLRQGGVEVIHYEQWRDLWR